jgi:hypothetical protein
MSGANALPKHQQISQHVAEQQSPLLGASDSVAATFNEYSERKAETPSQYVGRTRPSLGIAATPSSLPLRRPSFIDEEEQPHPVDDQSPSKPKQSPVTWMSLPEKGQLAVLTLARLSEPLSERSLSAYMFYQLRWFSPEASEATIASQGGILTAAFAAAQFLTAVWWGRAADSPRIGRKRVLCVGLFGTFLACMGIGFSTNFGFALFCRIMAGFLNGNMGVMRTMISEIIKDKRFVADDMQKDSSDVA